MAKRQPHKVSLSPIWAESDDVYKGVVRVGKADRGPLKTGRLHRFTCSTGQGRFILRGLAPNGQGRVRLDQDTRDILGVTPNSPPITFTITEADWLDELAWAWHSTDPGYRVATRLAIGTFVLGLILSPLVTFIHPIWFVMWAVALHARIERFAEHEGGKWLEQANVFEAAKWIGNEGTHATISRDDALDTFEMLEMVLDDIYVRARHALLEKVQATNTKFRKPKAS